MVTKTQHLQKSYNMSTLSETATSLDFDVWLFLNLGVKKAEFNIHAMLEVDLKSTLTSTEFAFPTKILCLSNVRVRRLGHIKLTPAASSVIFNSMNLCVDKQDINV